MLLNVVVLGVIITMVHPNIKFVKSINDQSFPSNFLFGVATSAYQVEGAWNESGKGECLWDSILHKNPSLVVDATNGDLACDFYHKVDEDIARLKYLKVNSFRFSISWSRVIPTGKLNDGINEAGLMFYLQLFQKLKEANIEPIVTLHHYDSPQVIHKEGFLIKETMNYHFVDYARFMFQTFGDKVKYWITFNESNLFCSYFWESIGPKETLEYDQYLCAHNVIKSHAMVYRMYAKEFKEKYNGKISLTILSEWNEPKRDTEEDRKAVQRKFMFEIGWIMHPLVYGDYPKVLKARVKQYSSGKSRLPEFADREKKYIKGTFDYYALNYYTPYLVEDKPNNDTHRTRKKDMGIETSSKPTWGKTITKDKSVNPPSFRKMINWIYSNYAKNHSILITEIGYVDDGKTNDRERVDFLRDHMNETLNAIHIDRINLIGFTVWSFLDDFEWFDGQTFKFGLYNVNFSSNARERTEKNSAAYFKSVADKRHL